MVGLTNKDPDEDAAGGVDKLPLVRATPVQKKGPVVLVLTVNPTGKIGKEGSKGAKKGKKGKKGKKDKKGKKGKGGDDEDDGEKIKFEVEVTRNRAKYEAPHFAVIKAWKVVPEGEKERKEEFEVPLPPPPPPRTNLERGIEFILPALILLQDVSARDQRRR
jgi:hypothetical protein